MRRTAAALLLSSACAGMLCSNPPPSDPHARATASFDPSPETSASFLTGAQQHIAAREYWASESEGGLQAPNRRHDLRTYFEPTGVRVHERTAGGSPRLVELQVTGVGRGDAPAAVAPGELTHREGRVEIRREGLVEWSELAAGTRAGLHAGRAAGRRSAG